MFSPKPLPYDLLLSPIASCFSVLNDLNLQKRDRKIEGYFHGLHMYDKGSSVIYGIDINSQCALFNL